MNVNVDCVDIVDVLDFRTSYIKLDLLLYVLIMLLLLMSEETCVAASCQYV